MSHRVQRFLFSASLLAVVSIARGDGAKPLDALQGTWKVVDFELNGQDVDDPQLRNAELTFEKDDLFIEPGDGSTKERFVLKPEADSSPAAFFATRIEPANRKQTGWMLYELKDGRLRIALSDHLGERPKSFDPAPKLMILELEKVKLEKP